VIAIYLVESETTFCVQFLKHCYLVSYTQLHSESLVYGMLKYNLFFFNLNLNLNLIIVKLLKIIISTNKRKEAQIDLTLCPLMYPR